MCELGIIMHEKAITKWDVSRWVETDVVPDVGNTIYLDTIKYKVIEKKLV